MRKLPVKRGLRVRAFDVLARAIEEGAEHGWNRAHKHTDKPDEFAVREAVTTAVMDAICEVFDFEDES